MDRLTQEQAIQRLADACRDAGGQYLFARQHGISRKWLNNVLRGRNTLSPGIALVLGLRKIVLFEDVGTTP